MQKISIPDQITTEPQEDARMIYLKDISIYFGIGEVIFSHGDFTLWDKYRLWAVEEIIVHAMLPGSVTFSVWFDHPGPFPSPLSSLIFINYSGSYVVELVR